jgi:hypothetical protein
MAAPNNPRSIPVVMDLGYRSNPNLHRAQKRPIQSADRSTAKVGDASQDFEPDLVRSDQLGSVTLNGKDDDCRIPGGGEKHAAHLTPEKQNRIR